MRCAIFEDFRVVKSSDPLIAETKLHVALALAGTDESEAYAAAPSVPCGLNVLAFGTEFSALFDRMVRLTSFGMHAQADDMPSPNQATCPDLCPVICLTAK